MLEPNFEEADGLGISQPINIANVEHSTLKSVHLIKISALLDSIFSTFQLIFRLPSADII